MAVSAEAVIGGIRLAWIGPMCCPKACVVRPVRSMPRGGTPTFILARADRFIDVRAWMYESPNIG